MNDNELDEMLNGWIAPPVRASLREKALSGFRAQLRSDTARRPIRRWIAVFGPRAAAIAAMGLFLLVLTKAAPVVLSASAGAQSAHLIVETENSYYAEDGSSSVNIYRASYDKEGREIPLSRSIPNDRLGTFVVQAGDLLSILHATLAKEILHISFEHNSGEVSVALPAGCAIEPVARETIVNYPTVAVSRTRGDGRRQTVWMAPDLGCFALKYTSEDKQPDGTFRLVQRTEALKVSMGAEQQ
jgi:hypothetical protein